MSRRNLLPTLALLGIATLPLAGCGGDGSRRANVALRKQIQTLQDENQALREEAASLRAARDYSAQADTPGAPATRPGVLFTTAGLKFGRLTGGFDEDDSPGDELLKVFVVPVDEAGDELKRAGGFEVTAFDAASDDMRRVGQWTFPADEVGRHWVSLASLYGYTLDCPLPDPADPATDLLVRVKFTESLTGKTFTDTVEADREPPG